MTHTFKLIKDRDKAEALLRLLRGGMAVERAASALSISPATAYRIRKRLEDSAPGCTARQLAESPR